MAFIVNGPAPEPIPPGIETTEVTKEITVPTPKPSKIEIALAEAESKKVSGLVKRWTFELSDIFKVPANWLTIDEKKIAEFMKEAVESGELKDGNVKVINGIKFYQSTSVRIN